ncbi:MAG: alpha/beta hydrolase [Bdellovibrio sp.]|nr:MAG: alpha/beta hydrolase [Bdellovibrio sp.]
MTKRFEGTFLAEDDAELFYQVWKPSKKSRGTVLITHGLAEHSECYNDLAYSLNEDLWTVVGWDLRGHGRSEGKRGYVRHFENYIDDLHRFIHFLKEQSFYVSPLILLGHSMGGLITLQMLLIYGQHHVDAVTLSSPALEVAVEVPFWKEKLAKVLAQYLPTITLYNEISYSDLVRDPQVIQSYESDPLRHDKISPMVFLGMQEGFVFVQSKAHEIKLPLLLQVAGQDKIVSTQASKDFFQNVASPLKKLIEYPKSYHEIFKDLDKEKVIADYKEFIDSLPLKKAEVSKK